MPIAKVIIDKCKDYLKRGQEEAFLLLLPTRELIMEGKYELLKEQEIKGLEGKGILSFDDFINIILEEYNSYYKIDDIGRQLILEDILKNLKQRGELKYFGKIASSPGLTWSLNQLISELKLAGALPADLEKNLENIGLKPKYEDIIAIYKEYQKTIEEKMLLDKEEKYLLALKLLKEGKIKVLENVKEVFLVHFLDLTPLQEEIFRALEKRVMVSSFNTDITDQSEKMAKAIKDNQVKLKIIKASGIDKEVREVAREIKKLSLQGIPLSQINLITRDLTSYTESIINIFSEMGIPYELPNKVKLSRNSFIKAFISLLQAILKNEDGFELPKLLKNSYIINEPVILKELLSAWPELGLKGTREEWLSLAQTKNLKSGIEFLQEFFSLWDCLPLEGTVKEYSQGVKAIIEKLGVEANLYKVVADESQNFDLLIRDYKAIKGLEGLLKEIEQLALLVGREDYVLTPHEYFQKISKTLQEGTYFLPNKHQGGVKITTPTQIRGVEKPYVFLVGLVEGTFPREIKADWLLKEEERKALKEQGLKLETITTLTNKERLYFDLVLSAVTAELIISYPETNETGDLNLPSKFIEELKGILEKGEDNSKVGLVSEREVLISEIFPTDWQDITSSKEFRAKAYNDIYHTNEKENLPYIRLLINKNFEEVQKSLAAVLIEDRRSKGKPTEWGGLLKDETVLEKLKEKYAKEFLFSISSLGDFGQCPFKYFAKWELKLNKLEEVQDELSPLDRGKLSHEILRLFFQKYKGKSLEAEYLEIYLDEIEEIAKAVFQTNDFKNLYIHPYFWDLEQKDIILKLKELIKAEVKRFDKVKDKGLKPLYFEWSFGNSTSWENEDSNSTKEPLVLQKDNQEVRFRGQIDRIDLADDSKFIVYDYKNSSGAKFEEMQKGVNIQLPIYILAVKKLLLKDKEAMGGAFYSVNKGKIDSSELLAQGETQAFFGCGPKAYKGFMKEQEWQTFENDLIDKIFSYILAIKKGEFLLTPQKCPLAGDWGTYCDYKEICRYEGKPKQEGGK